MNIYHVPRRIGVIGALSGSKYQSQFFGSRNGLHVGEDYYLKYFDIHQPREKQLQLPEEYEYRVEIIDAWECTITPLDGRFRGACTIPMPSKPYQALSAIRIN